MSESLKLVGFKRILNHATSDGSDTQLSIVPPPKGNAHFVARWWDKKANQKIYISCTKLAVEGSDLEIVVPSSFSTRLTLTYEGDVRNIVFGQRNDVSRVALIDKTTGEVAVEYKFPSIKNRTAKTAVVVSDDYDFDGSGATEPEPTPEPTPEPEGPDGGDGGTDGAAAVKAAEVKPEPAAPKKTKKATNRKKAVVTLDTPPDCGTCYG